MIDSSGYILVVHGSRNSNYAKQLQQLASRIQSRLEASHRSVFLATAYLELASKPLHQQIISFTRELASQGYQSVKILPLFLLSGTHVVNDIPQEITLARLDSPLPLELIPHLGASNALITLLQSQFTRTKTHRRILLAHGTSIQAANQELEKTASYLDAKVAYWSMKPYLSETIEEIVTEMSEGEVVAVLPYFLFTGKITETIVTQIQNLPANRAKQVILLPTLARTENLVEVIADLLLNKIVVKPRL